jgi:hypothetical protein
MASALEQKMAKRRKEAIAHALEKFPDCSEEHIIVSFFEADVVVDVLPPKGEPHRYHHLVEEDEIAEEIADLSTRKKRVVHGKF